MKTLAIKLNVLIYILYYCISTFLIRLALSFDVPLPFFLKEFGIFLPLLSWLLPLLTSLYTYFYISDDPLLHQEVYVSLEVRRRRAALSKSKINIAPVIVCAAMSVLSVMFHLYSSSVYELHNTANEGKDGTYWLRVNDKTRHKPALTEEEDRTNMVFIDKELFIQEKKRHIMGGCGLGLMWCFAALAYVYHVRNQYFEAVETHGYEEE